LIVSWVSRCPYRKRLYRETNMIRSYKGIIPKLGQRVYIDESAQIVGDVEIGDHSSVWMNAVVRGDVHIIRIGHYTNIQDNCVVHVFKDKHPTHIGDHVTVGHGVLLHGCRIEDHCLIGMGAIVLNGAVIGTDTIVAAGAVVREGMIVPAGSLVMGVPAAVKRPLTDEEKRSIRTYSSNYYSYKETYLAEVGT
jgi:carbonic anhydrase/acetyltransferase-like protein (isoleucine patch superfamily)